jgi:phage-related protein
VLTLPASLIIEKNKTASTSPWLILLETSLPTTPATAIRLVRNTDNITYDSKLYTAFPFELDAQNMVSKGEIPTLSLKVCNINRIMQSYIEEYDGLVGQELSLLIVSKPEGEGSYLLAATVTYDITGCVATEEWITWTLGAPNPLNRRFPLYRYIATHCNWAARFNTSTNIECGYYVAGSTITCNGTLDRCIELNKTKRFGGYIGLGQGNVRLV